MTKQVFLFSPHGNIDQHRVVDLDVQEAEQLISAGKATEVSFGDFETYREKAKQAHDEYQSEEKRLKESDNPMYKQPGVLKYELKKLDDEYEEKVAQIKEDYEESRAQMVKRANAKAARATIPVTEKDRQTAEQVANRIALNIAQSHTAQSINAVLSQATDDIGYLSDAEKVALQGKLSNIVSLLEQKGGKTDGRINSNTLIGATMDIRNMDLLAPKVAEQLPVSATIEYDQLKVIRKGSIGNRLEYLV